MRDIYTELRSLTDGDLEATETTTGMYIGQANVAGGVPISINVPEQDASADTLTITFEESESLAGTYRQIATAEPVITGTTVAAAPKQINLRLSNVLDYVRCVLTVTGSTPNFGAVTVGVDLGKYANVLTGGPATTAGGY